MSNFTYTVYELQQNNFDFGLNDYEIFKEEYRTILNSAIIEHYKFYEIGYSNPYRWRDRLRERMNLIMRTKYNKMYALKDIDFNPLYNVEMTETYEHEVLNAVEQKAVDTVSAQTNTTGKVETIDSKSSNVKSSQFPMDAMVDGEETSKIYIDAMNQNEESGTDKQDSTTNSTATNNNTSNVDSSGTTTETYRKFTEGSSAGLPFSKAMLQFKEFVEAFELDRQVIDDLKDLFITVWGDDIE